MKQASFLISPKDNIIKTKDEDTNDKITFNLTSDDNKNITSKKPIKLVENIYYFRS